MPILCFILYIFTCTINLCIKNHYEKFFSSGHANNEIASTDFSISNYFVANTVLIIEEVMKCQRLLTRGHLRKRENRDGIGRGFSLHFSICHTNLGINLVSDLLSFSSTYVLEIIAT